MARKGEESRIDQRIVSFGKEQFSLVAYNNRTPRGVAMKPMGQWCVWVVTNLFAASALADYELYNANDTKLDLQLNVIGAQFGQDQSWFGVSHSFLNASESHWTEFGTEFGAKAESKLWGGTFFAQASGVYTRTSGDDA